MRKTAHHAAGPEPGLPDVKSEILSTRPPCLSLENVTREKRCH